MTTNPNNNDIDSTTLQGSVNQLKLNVKLATTNASHFADHIQQLQAQITELTQQRDEAVEDRNEMHARLDRLVARLRLMGLEQSHYE
jgi:septal ring factor EnvC (AmiA/AmiB activator)